MEESQDLTPEAALQELDRLSLEEQESVASPEQLARARWRVQQSAPLSARLVAADAPHTVEPEPAHSERSNLSG
jgi:hypothetical protein